MKVPYKGSQVEVEEVEFFTRREDWNEYQLSDGSIIRIKLVVSDISAILGEKDLEGNPVYYIRSTTILRVRSVEKGK